VAGGGTKGMGAIHYGDPFGGEKKGGRGGWLIGEIRVGGEICGRTGKKNCKLFSSGGGKKKKKWGERAKECRSFGENAGSNKKGKPLRSEKK